MKRNVSSLAPLLPAAFCAILLAACDPWKSAYTNPVDPAALNYQGYPTVGSSADIRAVSPANDGVLSTSSMTITKVPAATAYELRIASAAASLADESACDFVKADFASNVLDISSASLMNGTKYYWAARSKGADKAWGGWSSASTFTTNLTPATAPTFSPAAGNYSSDQSVTIACASEGAVIRYTIDGSEPTGLSTIFDATKPISVAGTGTTMTVKAIASGNKLSRSTTASATYKITWPAAATPTFSPDANYYTSAQSVAIASSTTGVKIYYTIGTNGTAPADPTSASTLYTGPIAVAAGSVTTIKAFAAGLSGYTDSAVATAEYNRFLTMQRVEGGTFQMGSASGDADQLPLHSVILSSFFIGKYEVTQAQYTTVTGSSPSYNSSVSGGPVEQVTWFDAVEFCNMLSTQENLQQVYAISGRTPASGYPITGATVTADLTKNGYRLPTEAEWEFAARGGKSSHGYAYSGSGDIGPVAWYVSNSWTYTYWGYVYAPHATGKNAANELGLYDMSGNVAEWCQDWYGAYSSATQTGPTGPASGTYRLLRGGSYYSSENGCRVTKRGTKSPGSKDHDLGFRVIRNGQ